MTTLFFSKKSGMNHNIFQKIVDKIEPPTIYLVEYRRKTPKIETIGLIYAFPDSHIFPNNLDVFGIYKSTKKLSEVISELGQLPSILSVIYIKVTILPNFGKIMNQNLEIYRFAINDCKLYKSIDQKWIQITQ